jgi:quercetin dioxygenase-like cupin family protein
MRRILFVLVAVITLAGVVAYMTPASGQADKGTRDDLAGKLARREIQRSPLSIPNREMVQVETLIPAGVESGWHVHPGEEVGYIIAGQVEMRVQGRATVVLNAGDGFLIPPADPS